MLFLADLRRARSRFAASPGMTLESGFLSTTPSARSAAPQTSSGHWFILLIMSHRSSLASDFDMPFFMQRPLTPYPCNKTLRSEWQSHRSFRCDMPRESRNERLETGHIAHYCNERPPLSCRFFHNSGNFGDVDVFSAFPNPLLYFISIRLCLRSSKTFFRNIIRIHPS